jgi:hypothetical protein
MDVDGLQYRTSSFKYMGLGFFIPVILTYYENIIEIIISLVLLQFK